MHIRMLETKITIVERREKNASIQIDQLTTFHKLTNRLLHIPTH